MARRNTKKRSRGNSVGSILHGRKRTPINGHDNCSGRSERSLTVMRDTLMERAQRLGECVAAITEYIRSLPAATSCTEGAVYAGAGCVDGNMPRDVHETAMSGGVFDGGIPSFLRDMISAKEVSIVTPREAALNLQELIVLRELGTSCIEHPRGEMISGATLKGLQMLTNIRVKSNAINNSDVECIFRIGTLEEVAVTDSMHLTSVEGISQLTNLRALELDSTGIGDDCLKEICACSGLTQLSVSECVMITDVTPISKLVKLKALNLSNCHHITKGITELGQVPLLCDVDLSGTTINDGNLTDLCARGILERLKLNNCIQLTSVNPLSGLTALGELDLTGCRRVTGGVDTLGTLSVLRVLRLREVNLNETIIEGVGGSRALVSLSVESCTGLADVAPLSHIETLEKLEIRSCDSTISGVGNLGAVPRLRVLNMANIFFPPAGIDGLGASKSLVQFAVESAAGLHDVTPLASILSLEEVSLRGCGCVATGIGCLGSLPRLRKLDLTYTFADDDALRGVCGSQSLVSLNLSRCLGITDVSHVSQLRTLSELNLSGCRAIRAGWAELGKVPQLRVAVLSNTRITDGDVLSLSGLERLVTLDLSLCNEILDVTDLSTLSTLEELNVEGCSNIETGTCSLGGLPRLRVLKMRSVSVSDAAVRSLGNCQSLVKLILDNCTGFTDATPFSRLTALEEVSLHYCDTVKTGMGTLGMLPRLRTLDVGRTHVDNASLYGICIGSHSLVSLNLSNCKRVTCISAIAALKSLEELNLGNCCNITTGWEALGALQQLRVAVLSDTHIDDESLHYISECKCLTSLDLTSCLNLTDVTVLSSVAVLEELTLDGCRNIKMDIGALGALPKLRVLSVKEVEFNDPMRGISPSLGRCKSLVRLSASRSEGGIHGGCLLSIPTLEEIALDHRWVHGMPSLVRLPWLRVLNLKYTDIDDDGIKGISESKSLQSLNLSHCRKISDISRLSALTTLEELNINCCWGIKTGWEALGELLQLRVAILSETFVSDEVIAPLAACQYLRKLKLYHCERLTDVTAVYQIKSLEELIVRNCEHVHKGLNAFDTLPRLRILALRDVWTSDLSVESIGRSKSLVKIIIESCEEFADAAPLSNITTLEELTVRDCRHTVVNIGHLGRLPRLRFLALFRCDLEGDTLEDICVSRSLVSLDLRDRCKLTTIAPLANVPSLESLNLEDCMSIAHGWEALSKLPRLRNLDLQSTGVTNRCAAHHISECSSFVALNLESCDMTDASCLANMRTLEELHIGHCRRLTQGLGKLFSLPRLRVLYLASSEITDRELSGITPSDSIEELKLSWCERLTDVTALGRIKSMKKLHFRQSKDWRGRTEGYECLLELPHLCWVDLNHSGVPFPFRTQLRERRVYVSP